MEVLSVVDVISVAADHDSWRDLNFGDVLVVGVKKFHGAMAVVDLMLVARVIDFCLISALDVVLAVRLI